MIINLFDDKEEEKEVEDIKIEEPEETAGEAAPEEEAEKEPEEKAEEAEAKKAGEAEEPRKEEAPKKKEKKKKKDPRDEKIAELNDKHVRLMAEFENFRKRTDKEKEMMFETGAKSVIEKILPVVDNFERALGMADNSAGGEEKKDPFMEGMEMVYKQLMTELENIDVKPIEAVGKPFDPDIHNAVMQEESDEFESGTVAKELQKGYTYRGSVVRHSMVSVVQ
ncbi:MAG: nucleotide exchange factor GrpE [Lachnospiraceae bacterium]|nr:nucleotide exchange factor GrpE [Lachnospiraceae bacterium]